MPIGRFVFLFVDDLEGSKVLDIDMQPLMHSLEASHKSDEPLRTTTTQCRAGGKREINYQEYVIIPERTYRGSRQSFGLSDVVK